MTLWMEDARRYAANADYWRERAEAAEAALVQCQQETEFQRNRADRRVEAYQRFVADCELIKDELAASEQDRARLRAIVSLGRAEIEKNLDWLKTACYVVDVREKHHSDMPVLATVNDASDAMHALLFVRQAINEAALVGEPPPPEPQKEKPE